MDVECIFFKQKQNSGKDSYVCAVNSVSITKRFTKIATFKGTHIAGKTNADVDTIRFEDTTVHYFPRGVPLIFPNLTELTIRSCGLKEVSQMDLFGFDKIEVIHLERNALKSLPDDLFKNMPQVEKVWFGFNKIESLRSDLILSIKNQIKCISFVRNGALDAFHVPNNSSSISLDELMNVIDELTSQREILARAVLEESFVTTVRDGFENMRSSGLLSDFVIKAKNKEFRVHKMVLATRSRFFKNLFEKNPHEIQHTLNGFENEAVEDFLKFLYTGKHAPRWMTIFQVASLAFKYDVAILKTICEEYIMGTIDEHMTDIRLFQILALGNILSNQDMMKHAVEQIREAYSVCEIPDEMMDKPEAVRKLAFATVKRDTGIEKLKKECEASIAKIYSQVRDI